MFDILNFIEARKTKIAHAKGDMREFVNAYGEGKIAESQVSAWLMAVCLNGLDDANLSEFTEALSDSGQKVVFPFDAVDKHSTGGVGDKLTLLVVPIVAACGGKVAKLSGRGLGHTGGTVDKLEAIPGFNVSLSAEAFVEQVKKIGCAISGHSVDLAPAEGKFYSLRDTTATLDSIPLIASSIVSKKIAGGAKSIVYDVKCGNGAFMKDIDSARALADTLVALSKRMGRNAASLITDMSQPLGVNVGNSLEVIEAIETLKGKGHEDVRDLAVRCAGLMISIDNHLSDGDGEKLAKKALENGNALEKLRELIISQGGQGDVCDAPEKFLKVAPLCGVIECAQDGYVRAINAHSIGEGVKRLGGGRVQRGEKIDLEVGVRVLKKIGEKVSAGEPLLEIYANDEKKFAAAKAYFDVFGVEQ